MKELRTSLSASSPSSLICKRDSQRRSQTLIPIAGPSLVGRAMPCGTSNMRELLLLMYAMDVPTLPVSRAGGTP